MSEVVTPPRRRTRTEMSTVTLNRYAYRTFTGRMLNLAEPKPDDVCLEDIAHHLARVCRFGGSVHEYYSVASHSVMVAAIVEYTRPELARAALLHDATEAYLGDLVSGAKRLCPDYRVVEDLWAAAVESRFHVRFRHCPIIKDADLRARLSECRDLFSGTYPRELLLGGEGDREPWAGACRPLPPDEAEWCFLAYAHRLGLDT